MLRNLGMLGSIAALVAILAPAAQVNAVAMSTSGSAARPQTDRSNFVAPGYQVDERFGDFWERGGGLAMFGLPLSPALVETSSDDGHPYVVQYFERQRFEYHPEAAGTPYEVQLGRIGVELAARRALSAENAFLPIAPERASRQNCLYFFETGHQLCDGFLAYWRGHGLELGDPGISYRESLALFGLPLCDEFFSTPLATGVSIQYFERARFGYHPENAPPNDVRLGRLGAELLMAAR